MSETTDILIVIFTAVGSFAALFALLGVWTAFKSNKEKHDREETERKDARFGDPEWIKNQFLLSNFVNTHSTPIPNDLKIWNYLDIAIQYFCSIPTEFRADDDATQPLSNSWFPNQAWFALECAHRDVLTHYYMIAKRNVNTLSFGKANLRYVTLVNIVVAMRLASIYKGFNLGDQSSIAQSVIGMYQTIENHISTKWPDLYRKYQNRFLSKQDWNRICSTLETLQN